METKKLIFPTIILISSIITGYIYKLIWLEGLSIILLIFVWRSVIDNE